ARAAVVLDRIDVAEASRRAAGQAGATAIVLDDLRRVIDTHVDRRRHGGQAWAAVALGLLTLTGLTLYRHRAPRAAVRSLWPPPREVLYAAPPLGLLAAVGFTDAQPVGPAL